MIKKIILVIIFFSFFRVFLITFNYQNVYYEKQSSITGKIKNIKKQDDSVTFDIGEYRCSLYKEKFNYKLGDKVKVTGLITSPKNNTIPNLFNYRKYLLSKKIDKVLKVDNLKLIEKNNNILYTIKQKMIDRIETYKSYKYLYAFILGDTSKLEDENKSNYQNIGISHLLAVSGMHVGTFLTILNFLLKKVKIKNLIILLFLLFFLFITNFTESLMRCTLFIILNYINKYLKLNIKHSYILLLTAAILMLYNPYLIYSTGFLFSVTITFFIIISSDYINDKKSNLEKVFYVSLISFFASIPIISMTSFKINLLSPLYNIIFVPFVSSIIFPLSILTFIIKPLDELLLIIINIFERLSSFFANIKLLTFIVSKTSIIVVFLYYFLLIFSLKKNKKIILLFFAVLLININARIFIKNPEIIFLDVGQGDCNIIIMPYGKTVIIDTGGNPNSNYSISKNQIIPYLNSRGINKVEALILTHGDYDHMGGANELINNIKVGSVYINKGELNINEKKLIKKKKIDDMLIIGNYYFKFLNKKIYNEENKDSIVTYLNINNKDILLMGDADKESETNILSEYNLPNMYILKVGHHGSKTSSDINFVNNINPIYSVISVGENNKFGHPNKETINTLNKSKILLTSKHGTIRFVFNKNMVNKYFCKSYNNVER